MFDITYKFGATSATVHGQTSEQLHQQIPELSPHIFNNFRFTKIEMTGPDAAIVITKVEK
jgi:hypothetical protein